MLKPRVRQPSIGTMTGPEFAEALNTLHITASAFAVWCGVAERAVRRWRSTDDIGPPESVAMWVRYLIAMERTPIQVAEILEGSYPDHYAGLVEDVMTAKATRGPRRPASDREAHERP